MADERDFELLDDYLSNRMGEQDRSAFEKKMNADPDLRNEHALQQQLINGIKEARIAELKSMLNNVPVPAGNTGNALASKIVLGTVATIMIAAAAYWFTSDDDERRSSPATVDTQQHQQAPLEKPNVQEEEPQQRVEEQKTTQQQRVETDKNQTSAGTEHSKPSLAKRPEPLSAPGAPATTPDADSSDGSGTAALWRPLDSSITIEASRNAGHNFHYQFRDGKLILYGNFDKGSYRVMEFDASGKRRMFLSHAGQFYELLQTDDQVKALVPLRDPALISKLTELKK